MAGNSTLSMINFQGGGHNNRWTAVMVFDQSGSLDPIATGSDLYIENVTVTRTLAAVTDASPFIHIRLTDAGGNVLWGGANNIHAHIGRHSDGLSCDWVAAIGTAEAIEVVVNFLHVGGTTPTAV